MSAWVLIPSLIALRTEFNMVNPNRDKGADGSIGDSAHTSSSDHTPDEDSDVLRDHDADSKNEVHALDIDSTGPWPNAGWFDRKINDIRLEERRRWLDPADKCRLKYVIWNRQIANQASDFAWRDYGGSDPHTNHAHFSGRYETACENDTRPWGVAIPLQQEDDVPLTEAEMDKIAAKVWAFQLEDPYDTATPKRKVTSGGWVRYSPSRSTTATPGQVTTAVDALAGAIGRRLTEIESNLVTLRGAVQAISSREGQIITEEQLLNAIRRVLREGVSE